MPAGRSGVGVAVRTLAIWLTVALVISLIPLSQPAAQRAEGDVQIAAVRWGWEWGCGVYPGDRQVPLEVTFVNGEQAVGAISVVAHLEGLPFRGGGGEDDPRAVVSPIVVLPGGAFEATFLLDVLGNATPGVYRIPLTLTYRTIEVDSSSPISISWVSNDTFDSTGRAAATLPVLTYGPEVEQESVIEVVVGRPCGILSLGVTQYPSVLRAGDAGALIISLRNLGREALRDVLVEVEPVGIGASFQAAGGSPGFDLRGLTTGGSSLQSSGVTVEGRREFFFESIPPMGSARFTVSVRVSEGCPRGIYQLPVRVSYRRVDGTHVEELTVAQVVVSTPLSRPASIEPDRPHINIVSALTSPDPLPVGGSGSLTIVLLNAGPGDAYGLSLDLLPAGEEAQQASLAGLMGMAGGMPYMGAPQSSQAGGAESPLRILRGANRVFLGDLKAGENVTVSFEVGVDPTAESGFLEVPLLLRYRDELGNRYEESLRIAIPVARRAELALTLEDSPARPGEDVTLRGDLVNLGEGDAEGVVVELVDGGGYFRQLAPAVVSRIPGGDREDVGVRLLVSDATPPGTYELPLRVSYRSGLSQTVSVGFTAVVVVESPSQTSGGVSLRSLAPWIALAAGSGAAGVLGLATARRKREGPHYEPENFSPVPAAAGGDGA